MKQASQVLSEFVLNRIHEEQIAQQIELYRALEAFAPTPKEAKEFRAIREDLISATSKHCQLMLRLRTEGGAS
jgi:hypothetical protein